MYLSSFDPEIKEQEAKVPFISISHGKDTMPMLVRRPDTLEELKRIALRKYPALRRALKIHAFIPAERFGLGEDTIIGGDAYVWVKECLVRLVWVEVEVVEGEDDEVDEEYVAVRLEKTNEAVAVEITGDALIQDEEQVPDELAATSTLKTTTTTTTTGIYVQSHSPPPHHEDADPDLPSPVPSPKPLPERRPDLVQYDEEEHDELEPSRVPFVPRQPASPVKRKGKLLLSDDEDDIQEVVLPRKKKVLREESEEEEQSPFTSSKNAARGGSLKMGGAGKVVGDVKPKKMVDEPVAPASQSTIKKERVSKTEQLRNPALANSSSDDKESESFLVTISHPHSGKEVRCKVRGRNAIKKVVDGACKGLRLDAHRTELYHNVTYQDEMDEAVTEKYICSKDETVAQAGIREGAKLILIVDGEEDEESE